MGLCSASAAHELLIIAVFVLIIFGPDKIPEIARTAGKAIQMFKRAQQDVEHVIKTEIYTPDLLSGFDGSSKEKPASSSPAPAPTLAAEQASSASAIWSAASDGDDEEGEEE